MPTKKLTEHEAWLLIHEMIVATKGQAMVNRSGDLLLGLCAAVIAIAIHEQLIGRHTENQMLARIGRAIRRDRNGRVYFTRPGNWTNGVRARYALEFAEETDPKETPC